MISIRGRVRAFDWDRFIPGLSSFRDPSAWRSAQVGLFVSVVLLL